MGKKVEFDITKKVSIDKIRFDGECTIEFNLKCDYNELHKILDGLHWANVYKNIDEDIRCSKITLIIENIRD